MSYIAGIALVHCGRIIAKGAKVPDDYKRLAEGIKRGWVVVKGDPAAIPPPAKPATKAPDIVDTGIIAPEIAGEPDGPLIEDLDYLNPMAKGSLSKRGITRVSQLEGLDVDALRELHGIGLRIAERLTAEYEAYSTAPRSGAAEYSNMPEDDHGGYETKATGEDESEDESEEDD